MILASRAPPALVRSEVGCHELDAVEDFDSIRGEPHIDLLTDQPIRNGVIGALDLDVVIRVHLGPTPFPVLVALTGSGRNAG